jgi:small subunit ribosomal protein S18
MMRRPRECYFCVHKLTRIDYKDPVIRDYLTEKGKIVSRKLSGLCARHQRWLARAIKTARGMAIVA